MQLGQVVQQHLVINGGWYYFIQIDNHTESLMKRKIIYIYKYFFFLCAT